MDRSSTKSKALFGLRIMVILAMLTALSVALKALKIDVTPYIRITFETLPVALAAFLYGPVAGLICGALADVLGCVTTGMVIQPVITAAAGLFGLAAGLMRLFIKSERFPFVLLCDAVPHVLASMGLKSVGLRLLYGTPWEALAIRVPLYMAISALETVLIYILYRKGVMKFIRRGREKA